MATSNSLIKIVLVGDGASGKSCMIQSYLNDSFDTDYIPTVFDNYKATVQVENQTYQLAIWDTAGEEEYHLLRNLSYQQTDVFLICFPVNDRNSFRNAIRKWHQELEKSAPRTPKIFVGTKIDLRDDDGIMNMKSRSSILQPTTSEEVETMISELNATYLECSALTQEGLKPVFDEAIRTELRNRKRADGKPRSKNPKKKDDCNMF